MALYASPGVPPLPRLPASAPPELQLWADQVVSALNSAFTQLTTPAGTYAVTNLAAAVRALNADGTATAADVSQVLATLIVDLQNQGTLNDR